MAWFLTLQGPTQGNQQSSVYELQDGADVDKLAQELVSAVSVGRVVADSSDAAAEHPQAAEGHPLRPSRGVGDVDLLRTFG